MPQHELMRTEFFNDFLARDGLYWGVNAYSYVGSRNIGDIRIWRSRQRENFDGHTLELLRLIEPAFTAALVRAAGGSGGQDAADGSRVLNFSVRELEIARMISDDLSDKEIAHRLGSKSQLSAPISSASFPSSASAAAAASPACLPGIRYIFWR